MTEDGRGYVWSVGRKVERLGGSRKLACLIGTSNDGRQVVGVDVKARLLRWSKVTGKPKVVAKLPWTPTRLDVDGAAKRAMLAAKESVFALASLKTGSVTKFTCGSKEGESRAVSAQSRRVVAVHQRAMYVCSPKGRSVLTVPKHNAGVAAFARGGTRLVTRLGSSSRYITDLSASKPAPDAIRVQGSSSRTYFDGAQISADGRTWLVWRTRSPGLGVLEQDASGGRFKFSGSEILPSGLLYYDSTTRRAAVMNMDRASFVGLRVYRYNASLASRGSKLTPDVCRPKSVRHRWKWDVVLPVVLQRATKATDQKLEGFPCDQFEDVLSLVEPSRWRRKKMSPSKDFRVDRARGSVEVISTTTKAEPRRFDCGKKTVRGSAVSPDDKRLVVLKSRSLCVGDLNDNTTKQFPITYLKNRGELRSVAFGPRNEFAVALHERGYIQKYDLSTGDNQGFFGPPRLRSNRRLDLPQIEVEPSGKTALTLTESGDLTRWDLATGRMINSLAVGLNAVEMTLSEDRRRVYVAYAPSKVHRAIRVVSRAKLKPVATMKGFSSGGWLVYDLKGQCWVSDGSGRRMIPSFAIKRGRPTKGLRACRNPKVLKKI